MKKKNPGIAARLAAANADLDNALGVFETAAARLDAATEAHEDVRADAAAQIARLTEIEAQADARAAKARNAAANVRSLIG